MCELNAVLHDEGITAVESGGASQTGTLERGLRMLEIFVSASGPMSLSRVAEEANVDPSTAHRLLRVLVQLGYVIRDPATRKYHAGPRVLIPLSLYHPLHQFRRDSNSALTAFREESGLTVALVLFIRHERMVVEIIAGSERLSPYYDTHLKRPIHSSATGKVLLAAIPSSEWAALLGSEPYPATTPATLTTDAQLEQDLKLYKEQGFTSTFDESVKGLSAVAAPIKDHNGRTICCIVGFGHSTGLLSADRRDAMGSMVKRAAELVAYTSNSLQALGANFGATQPGRAGGSK